MFEPGQWIQKPTAITIRPQGTLSNASASWRLAIEAEYITAICLLVEQVNSTDSGKFADSTSSTRARLGEFEKGEKVVENGLCFYDKGLIDCHWSYPQF